MQFADVLEVSRANLFIVFPGLIATPDFSFANHDPWIVMTENSGIFLVARRIGGYFAILDIIFSKSRVVEHNSIVAVEVFFY